MSLFVYRNIVNQLHVGLGGGSLFQFANRAGGQMMTYLIVTPDGKLVMIDSGHAEEEDALYMLEAIKQHGGVVEHWFFTHAHNDHFGGFLWLAEHDRLQGITVKNLHFSFPTLSWLLAYDQTEKEKDEITRFFAIVEKSDWPVHPLEKGMTIGCGGMTFEMLSSCERYENFKDLNDTSIVIRANFPKRPVLFLGDLAAEGGRRLLQECDHEKLRCDIVQMAHHGQHGVERSFYEVVLPKVCLYTAPDWLWDCDNGGGFGSGPWETLQTRQWMEELGAQVSCPHAYGDYLLD
ncbi:MAG: MBL fold metallo-hydrolase [Clostridia bacterium]|nr:MBL fold metallo-hydrolase [Clostridia bacterium]